jgi:hypothetical protein
MSEEKGQYECQTAQGLPEKVFDDLNSQRRIIEKVVIDFYPNETLVVERSRDKKKMYTILGRPNSR